MDKRSLMAGQRELNPTTGGVEDGQRSGANPTTGGVGGTASTEPKKKSRKRRGRGEDSISQLPSGLWYAQVSLGYDGNGKRKRRRVYAATKAELIGKLNKLRADRDKGEIPVASKL